MPMKCCSSVIDIGVSHVCHCLDLVRHLNVPIYSIGLTKECDLLLVGTVLCQCSTLSCSSM